MEQRITLISDPTDEFPQNTSSNFKMRIPNGLRLEGKGWQIALLSLSLPNSDTATMPFVSGADNLIAQANYSILHFKGPSGAPFNQIRTLDYTKKVNDRYVDKASNGVDYWNKVIQAIEQHVIFHTYLEKKRVQDQTNEPNPMMWVRQSMCPSFRWEGDELIIHRRYPDVSNKRPITKPINHNIYYSYFDIAYEVALQWGLIRMKQDGIVVPGPNLQMQLFQDVITTANPRRQIGLGVEGIPSLNGNALRPQFNLDMPRGNATFVHPKATVHDVMWYYRIGRQRWVRLSGNIEWRLTNLNSTYDAIHRHVGKAVMVYSNLQQSNLVGSSSVQLLRQLVARQGGHDGHTYAEPKHLEWIPVSTHQTDIVEVQLADVTGALLTLPKGKSLVTVAFKQKV